MGLFGKKNQQQATISKDESPWTYESYQSIKQHGHTILLPGPSGPKTRDWRNVQFYEQWLKNHGFQHVDAGVERTFFPGLEGPGYILPIGQMDRSLTDGQLNPLEQALGIKEHDTLLPHTVMWSTLRGHSGPSYTPVYATLWRTTRTRFEPDPSADVETYTRQSTMDYLDRDKTLIKIDNRTDKPAQFDDTLQQLEHMLQNAQRVARGRHHATRF